MGIGPTRSSCQCMWVFTMPGMTYFPVASITASASGHFSAVALPIRAMSPASTSRSTGPNAGTPVPGITIALRITRRAASRPCTAGRAADEAGACAEIGWRQTRAVNAHPAARADRFMPGILARDEIVRDLLVDAADADFDVFCLTRLRRSRLVAKLISARFRIIGVLHEHRHGLSNAVLENGEVRLRKIPRRAAVLPPDIDGDHPELDAALDDRPYFLIFRVLQVLERLSNLLARALLLQASTRGPAPCAEGLQNWHDRDSDAIATVRRPDITRIQHARANKLRRHLLQELGMIEWV